MPSVHTFASHCFLEELIALTPADDEAGYVMVTGLFVFRLVDRWLADGPQIVATDLTDIRRIKRDINSLREGSPFKSIFQSLIGSIEAADTASVAMIAAPLLAYGRAWRQRNRLRLAEAIFRTLQWHSDADPKTNLHATLELANVQLLLGHLDRARRSYRDAAVIADRLGDMERSVVSRLGVADVSRLYGNVPRARELLTALEEDTRRAHPKFHALVLTHAAYQAVLHP